MNEPLPDTLILDRLDTPIGTAIVVTDEAGVLRAFNWTDYEERMNAWISRRYPGAAVRAGRSPIRAALEAYFAGEVKALERLAWAAIGTSFQRQVWTALCQIPTGETWSYARLAQAVGRPTAVRAVGLANGSNPVALVVPCHRVIGSNGTLTGYGGGLPRKRWLLAHEGASFRDQMAA
ncbi:methylated-DNA--[protein]-cysteine S-methyltransferase [Phenylobacterium deserti]|uniref:Methylated-DNA--protein-cysteine methyltransferase n=1 Tax=Phenylobacterium deserti TaxID=1914756 RepID=A0A328ADA3_9CAUL|nr:methylated-DNA--[protein]-cysteine S-methyltransferase [Phenylobacterium deserti]RAK52487.1 methylated-DNA--protein-cysteine methyltransferase [Phenylobacterium deserti]